MIIKGSLRITVKAHPKANKIRVVEKDASHFEVWVREAADQGRANEAIVEAISNHFQIAKSKIRILHGERGINKILEIR